MDTAMKRDLGIVLALALLLAGWLGWQTREDRPEPVRLQASGLLTAAPEDFRRVTAPEPLEFPADHALHPGYRNEWWYFTGSLDLPDGPAGFQFTLFRFALDPGPTPQSDWHAEAVWMAHLAVSDGTRERFYQAERFARGALGLAGADTDRWWLRDWQVLAIDEGWHLAADAGDFAIELDMAQLKPFVLQGDQGYSQKGPEPGNASRYYSATRLAASGRIRLDNQWQPVEGHAWLDREWGSSQLSDDLAGWDWFALQLDDGRDLMVYRLRHHDGSASPFSAGVVVAGDGTVTHLAAEDFETVEQRWWRDRDGDDWPVEWRVRVPNAGLDLHVEPLFDEQRWDAAVIYWEGAMRVHDADSGEPLGRGYLELSGYAD
jgi:predicted secreted hydrolase